MLIILNVLHGIKKKKEHSNDLRTPAIQRYQNDD